MNSKALFLVRVAFGLMLLLHLPILAEHRATHLGNPNTRFAPPIKTEGDLRKRFRDDQLKQDIAFILEQWGWKGNLDDLYYAALTAPVVEVELPVGTRMPFMSSREKGQPILLRDVVWDGKAPVEAYAFRFSSNGRKYRCVTPKACSNFYLEDLGGELPVLQLAKVAPTTALLCDPLEFKLIVHNSGEGIATGVVITDSLPEGLRSVEGQSTVRFEVGTLGRGARREFTVPVTVAAVGIYRNEASVTSAEGITAKATSTTEIQAPVLALDCVAPASVLQGRPAEVCLKIRNIGKAVERAAIVSLPIPEGFSVETVRDGGVAGLGVVTWELPALAPGAEHQVCAVINTPRAITSLPLVPTVRGICAPAVQSACTIQVEGVPGILLEVVDLEDPVEAGKEVTYVITVTNQGLLTGTQLRLTCTLPDSQGYISSSGPTLAQVSDRMVTFDPLASLGGGERATWEVVVRALRPDDARFLAELRSDQFVRPIPEMEATQQF